jgi:hypothetical protein
MLIRIFTRKASSKWGIGTDARIAEQALRHLRLKEDRNSEWIYEHVDPLMWVPPVDGKTADIHIYDDIPTRLAIPWATYNMVIVNPEWWPAHAWDWAFAELDLFVFKSPAAAALFPEVPAEKQVVFPWRSDEQESYGTWVSQEDRFLYVIGGSANKVTAAKDVIRWWRREWPTLEVRCTPPIKELLPIGGPNVEVLTEYLDAAALCDRQKACKWHVTASAAEGFGYTLAEAAVFGAPSLRTDLPVQTWTWGHAFGSAGLIATGPRNDLQPVFETEGAREGPVGFTESALVSAVEGLLSLTPAYIKLMRDNLRERRKRIHEEFRNGWSQVWRKFKRDRHAPTLPVNPAKGAIPPKVGVITVTRGRADWWGNMVQNVTKQSWPISRLEWIIVDDGEASESLRPMVDVLCDKLPALSVRYVEMPERATIGFKRNAAVQAAATDVDVFVSMDDDDHYPVDSISSRVSWLEPTRKGTQIAYCSTLPMYDTRRYVSAVNVPPLTEAPAHRVSEATLAFTRAAWNSRPFPDSSAAEGYQFVHGREAETVEIPPQGVIVSFIHRGNTSSRRIPADQEPNGCHYGFTDGYFSWLSRVGGGMTDA